jgi:hypothetical protein
VIIALAGRRIDDVDADEIRFPASNIAKVRRAIGTMLESEKATALVSSAACGADLLGLSEAGRLGLRRRVILPFEKNRFRETSVTDRSGDWGPIYDEVLDQVEAAGDLVVLPDREDHDPYTAANHAILEEAFALTKTHHQGLTALLVWDGVPRGEHDLTEEFGLEARERKMDVLEVLTI